MAKERKKESLLILWNIDKTLSTFSQLIHVEEVPTGKLLWELLYPEIFPVCHMQNNHIDSLIYFYIRKRDKQGSTGSTQEFISGEILPSTLKKKLSSILNFKNIGISMGWGQIY